MDSDAERLLFDFGTLVLGKKSGGLIVQLKKRLGIEGARIAIKMASGKSNPREYIGAVLRGKETVDTNRAQIGEVNGKYIWTGSRWKEIESSPAGGGAYNTGK